MDPVFDNWLVDERARHVTGISLPHRSTPPVRALRLGVMPPRAHSLPELAPISLRFVEEITATWRSGNHIKYGAWNQNDLIFNLHHRAGAYHVATRDMVSGRT